MWRPYRRRRHKKKGWKRRTVVRAAAAAAGGTAGEVETATVEARETTALEFAQHYQYDNGSDNKHASDNDQSYLPRLQQQAATYSNHRCKKTFVIKLKNVKTRFFMKKALKS